MLVNRSLRHRSSADHSDASKNHQNHNSASFNFTEYDDFFCIVVGA